MKRIFDLLLAVAMLMILVAPMLLIVIAVRLSSKGPTLYWSDRVGKNNKIYPFSNIFYDLPSHVCRNNGKNFRQCKK